MIRFIPRLLHLCITDYCQLKCKHCYFGDYKRTRQLTLEEILLVHNKFFELRHRFIKCGYNYREPVLNISGGEPMLHSKIMNVANILPQYYNTVKFLTNGMQFSSSVIKMLLQNSTNLIYQISLDGTKDIHDYIRGSGTFDTISMNIIKIKDLFPELNIQISFNVNNKNKECLSELVPYVKELGVNSIMMDRYVPYNISDLKILSYDEYKTYDSIINNLYTRYNDDNFKIHRNRSLQHDMTYSCGAVIENQICYTNGDRFACTRYQVKTGNWFYDDIDTLFTNSMMVYNSIMRMPKECEGCIYSKKCNGGMRCLSYCVTKKDNIKDIHCFKFKGE